MDFLSRLEKIKWDEPVDWNSDYVTKLMILAFVTPLGIQVILFLCWPLLEWLGVV